MVWEKHHCKQIRAIRNEFGDQDEEKEGEIYGTEKLYLVRTLYSNSLYILFYSSTCHFVNLIISYLFEPFISIPLNVAFKTLCIV